MCILVYDCIIREKHVGYGAWLTAIDDAARYEESFASKMF